MKPKRIIDRPCPACGAVPGEACWFGPPYNTTLGDHHTHAERKRAPMQLVGEEPMWPDGES